MKNFISFNKKKLTPQIIRELYRDYLGREVESEDVIDSHLKGHKTVASLRKSILLSAEYQSNGLGRDLWCFLSSNLSRPAPIIEIDTSPENLQALFTRISTQWCSLGQEEPHWSVITDEKYRAVSFNSFANDFFLSGQHTASLIDIFAERNGIQLDRSHVLELGCGTGRITASLAETFKEVTAVDVSESHLDLCRDIISKNHHNNVDMMLLKSPQDADNFPVCSFFLSVIVLQHNPPPLAYYILDQALAKVSSGGAALFQVPTHFKDYHFHVADYLASPMPATFEMHCLPMNKVLCLLQKHCFTPLEVIMDTWTGLPGSHTFFAIKK